MDLSEMEGNGHQMAGRVGTESPHVMETDCRVL